jgi:sugar phosphate permease
MLLPVGRSGWAIAAGYLGLISVLLLPGPLAVICGILAIVHMKKNPELHGMGRAIFGLVMGGLGTLVLMIVAVVFLLK